MTREEAIKRIENLIRGRKDKRGKTELDFALDMAIETLKKERPHGEWEHWGSPFTDDTIANSIVCSICKARYVEIEGEVFNLCPNCGASMSANDRQVTGKLDENTQKHYGFRKKY